MTRHRDRAGELTAAVGHFVKVSRSYRPGLFHCYAVPQLPRTNNDLEQLFGSYRWHERRITGRKTASAALVGRGSVRLPAAVATGRREYDSSDLAAADVGQWRSLRAGLDRLRDTRRQRTRFRRDPQVYLQHLESRLLRSALPP